MQVTKRDGSLEQADKRKIARGVERACRGLADVDADLITEEAYQQLHDKIATRDIDRSTVLSARARIVLEPNYSYVASRLLLYSLYREAFGHQVDGRSLNSDYREAFVRNVGELQSAGRLAELSVYDLGELAKALKPERDFLFKYFGLQTLYDRYFIHIDGRRMETPQAFWMRVAMGLCLNEAEPNEAAVSAYELMSTFRYCPSTPTLFNAATRHSQLSSCYLSTVHDSIDGIYGTLHNQARLSKYAGGLAVDVTPLRATNAYIKGTNGPSQGVIPWCKQFNDMAVAVNQGSKRKGALVLSLEVWHADFLDFLDLKKNTGDDRRRCHDINTANWIPDLFMKRVEEDGEWYLFSPDECPDLHSLTGEAFEEKYAFYSRQADEGKMKVFFKMKAKDIWKKMLAAIKETGHPWMSFKDEFNRRYNNGHVGVVNSSNLCQEVGLHTKATLYDEQEVVELGETAVCNLGSVNLSAHTSPEGALDEALLTDTVFRAVRLLDNVIDLNFYPTREARHSNLQHRPVGLGLMGWADFLHKKKLAYDSPEAVELADEVQEHIAHAAVMTSSLLAMERGAYKTYEGSLWSRGVLPIDTARDSTCKKDWGPVRESVKKFGMRNGLVMAIAPNATIAHIVGCSPCGEPDYSVMYVNSTLSGDFTMVNEYFVDEMKKLGVWGPELAKRVQQVDGDVLRLVLPRSIKDRFKGAFDVDQKKLLDTTARRQKWVDQSISTNLFYDGKSMKELSDLYFHAWRIGCKTTYYLRTRSASKVEKSVNIEPSSSGTCTLGEICESCQ